MDRTGRMHVKVRLRSGAEYSVDREVVEVYSDDFTDDDAYLYGVRTNGRVSLRGRRRSDTRGQLRWFYLRNAELVD